MYDLGHSCLLVFAQGSWKDHYKKELKEILTSNFLSQLKPRSEEEAKKIAWNEVNEEPFFEPPPRKYDCDICSFISEAFQEKKGINEGMLLFTHNVLDAIGFKAFFAPLIKNTKIKKILYFELGIFDEKDFLSHKKCVTKQARSHEIFEIVDNNLFENGIIYEILNY
ncbi:MAG: hypothetical protein GY870_20965 [archaeon]|nr:hypothetical protein [archaeon]